MKLEEAVATFQPVSQKALKRLVDDGLISEPLTDSDQHTLSVLCQIWSSEWYVAQMNMTFKPDKRALMLAFPNFGKIERYILNSYLPDEFKQKSRVSVMEVSTRIREFFHIEYPEFKILRIRQIAYNMLRNRRGETRKLFLALSALERKSSQKRLEKSVKKSK
ncbi:hypothetical protein OR1_00691 [Geobacter sp. OR-1]|uniref:hypothetical protein n=1 Tax=Geobacter sp. OR-1 TaxID=1266765 RepID=UPI000543B6CF|nr:hypothetical protein [Geobacter sp. OR-1]GAM08420.1 hypothetical protein OR1_00691 [Geobacter sp. OR-1]